MQVSHPNPINLPLKKTDSKSTTKQCPIPEPHPRPNVQNSNPGVTSIAMQKSTLFGNKCPTIRQVSYLPKRHYFLKLLSPWSLFVFPRMPLVSGIPFHVFQFIPRFRGMMEEGMFHVECFGMLNFKNTAFLV